MSDANEKTSDNSVERLTAGKSVGAERYLLKKLLGQGGMGLVWLAQDLRLREPVALKFLPQPIAFDPAAIEDLRKETLRSRRLSHPNIVRIHDLCETRGEPTFIAMEYVDGPNLHYLRAHRPSKVLSWKFIMPLLRQLCEALEYAHGERILHRDLKPANLMQDSNGRLKLADFGLACVIHDSVARVSGQLPTHGTLPYMSPQQARGEKPAVSDDIYSLGATLYELLTSQPPFHAGDLAYQVNHNRPQDMRERLADLELNNEISSEVSAMVMACLAKEPEQRPQSAKSILEWLDATDFTKPALASAVKAPAQDVKTSPAAVPLVPPNADACPARKEEGSHVAQLSGPTSVSAEPASIKRERPERAGDQPQPRRKSTLLWLGTAAALLLTVPIAFWVAHSMNRDHEIVPAPAEVVSSAQTVPVVAPEFEELFNGRDLTGWYGDPSLWSVKDGLIIGNFPKGKVVRHSTCLIWRGGQVEDFELHASFRFYRGNSGVFYRARDLGQYNMGGYQFEIMPGGTGNLIEVGTDRARREFVHRNQEEYAGEIEPNLQATGWNELVIIARGHHLTQKLNGVVVADVQDSETQRQLSSGWIGFELARMTQTLVEFKNVRMKKLDR